MLEELYTEWAMDYCNNYFKEEELPAGFKLAVKMLVESDPLMFDVTSQSLHDMSTSYSDSSKDGIPRKILKWLEPYRRLNTI